MPLSDTREREGTGMDEPTNLFSQQAARWRSEWHEDYGDVVWWVLPVQEAPYLGSPLCDDWPGYHTHWTRIELPANFDQRVPSPRGRRAKRNKRWIDAIRSRTEGEG